MTPAIVLGPAVCQGCHAEVYLYRDPAATRWMDLTSTRSAPYRVHRCVRGSRCGALMPMYHDRCARRVGHRFEHRSRYALDNASRARRLDRAA